MAQAKAGARRNLIEIEQAIPGDLLNRSQEDSININLIIFIFILEVVIPG